ncbi:unnamed protein product [Rhodiola kirilowii]
MEKVDSIDVENGGGVVVDVEKVVEIAVQNSGGTKTEKETTIGGEIEKVETIAVNNKAASEKKENEASKGGKKKAAGVAPKRKKKSSSRAVVITAADNATTALVSSDGGAKGCRVQVSNTKKPLFFYLNVAKRYIKQNNYVELSALGMAIPTVVTISEILMKDGWVTEKKIGTSTVTLKDEAKGRIIMKARIEISLEKHKGSAAKGLSVNSEKRQSAESNGKLIEKKDHYESKGTLTEKKASQNPNLQPAEGKVATGNEGKLSVKKETCGVNRIITEKENTILSLAAVGK